jgi:hypothetical protein
MLLIDWAVLAATAMDNACDCTAAGYEIVTDPMRDEDDMRDAAALHQEMHAWLNVHTLATAVTGTSLHPLG